ncbi:hypothetical protein BpHYR1_040578 [Brachionus plicatilis]|uniref:Uncharacterized protein n=1 Tax=Brachionus plicatilis TaxID=10195 RepID=A0A3M7RGS8_BRAPC|nr:hypothetical protein BpHYR1_040578 [Brachionus plicatilis]
MHPNIPAEPPPLCRVATTNIVSHLKIGYITKNYHSPTFNCPIQSFFTPLIPSDAVTNCSLVSQFLIFSGYSFFCYRQSAKSFIINDVRLLF